MRMPNRSDYLFKIYFTTGKKSELLFL